MTPRIDWHCSCLSFGMAAARRFEELIAWQLSAALRDQAFALTEAGRAASDRKFCDQIRDSTSSAPRNLAEGFGHFQPRQFAKFVRIARASLTESLNHIDDGRTRKYFTDADAADMTRLARRALGATTRLLKYLESCDGRAPTGWDADPPPGAPSTPTPPSGQNIP